MKTGTKTTMVLIAITMLILAPAVITKADSNQTQNTGFASPTWHNATPANNTGVAYSPGYHHAFSVDWADAVNVSITQNFTGTQETTLLEGTNNTYKYETGLSAGTYTWKMTAEGLNKTKNKTPEFVYTVEKAKPAIALLLNNETNNITIKQGDHVNITGTLEEGETNLTLKISGKQYNGKNITLTKEFNETGEYNVTLQHNETQNYTQRKTTKTIIVEEKPGEEYELLTNKHNYKLGEEMEYLVRAPSPSNVTIEISRKTKFGDSYWHELIDTKTLENKTFPALLTNKNTKKPGEYIIEAILHAVNQTLTLEYNVTNSMEIEVKGKKDLETGEETSIKATAKGGISPYEYEWDFEGTKTKDSKLETEIDEPGTYDVTVKATDSEGNEKEKTITILVEDYHDLTVEVTDSNGNALEEARILITDTGDEDWTASNGRASFRLPSEEYRVRATKQGYHSSTKNIDLDEDKSITIELEEREETTTTTTGSDKISLITPENNAELPPTETMFEASVDLDSASCKLFVAEQGSQWFAQIAEKQISEEREISFTENLDEGTYQWKIECETESESYESSTRTFTIGEETAQVTTTTIDESVIDAGDLRQKLEDASDNIASLELDDRKAADALGAEDTIRRSLRDYERILRDINSMQFRRDLTEEQRQERLSRFREEIREIEKITPISIEVRDSEEFINFPDTESLRSIAETYQEERNIQGHLDMSELESLQGRIQIRTTASQAKITFINGDEKEITLVYKLVEYTGETTRNQFLIEKIPGELSGNLEVLSEHESIKRNELLRLDKLNEITYYSEGYKDLEAAKQAYTVLITESVYRSTRTSNPITGNITLSNLDMDTTTWLVILLVVLLLAYIAYAFDLIEKTRNFNSSMFSDKKYKEMIMLVNDAKDYLETGNIERATLIYKDVKLQYENLPKTLKNKVYPEAIALADTMNEKYLSGLITQIHEKAKNNKGEAVRLYNKSLEAYKKLSQEAQASFRDQMLQLRSQLKNG